MEPELTMGNGNEHAWWEVEATCPGCQEPFEITVTVMINHDDVLLIGDDYIDHLNVCPSLTRLILTKMEAGNA